MRATSTAVSVFTHVVLVVAALRATAGAHPRVTRPYVIVDMPGYRGPVIDVPPPPPVPGELWIDDGVTVPVIPTPVIDGIDAGGPVAPAPPAPGPIFASTGPGDEQPVDVAFVDQVPAILAGPIPAYPDLLRQAGIQGRVLLEAVVDTVGHVERGSIVVVAAAHPGFVAAARQAIAATLFRPARVRGRAVRVRVRIPMDFALRR